MSEKQLAEKTLEDNMVEVHVTLYEPFYNFLKEYLAFFGSKQTIENLCRGIVYQEVKYLYEKFEGFIKDEHIEDGAWFNKWPHIGCVSFDAEDEEES